MDDLCFELSTFALPPKNSASDTQGGTDQFEVKSGSSLIEDALVDEKFYRADQSTSEIFSRFEQVRNFSHPNLVRYIEVHALSGNRVIVSAEGYNKTLEQVYAQKCLRNDMFTENELVRIAYDVLHGLGYLHRLGMPHLCLHSSCIMICSDGTTKLGRHSQPLLLGLENVQRRDRGYCMPEDLAEQDCNPFQSDLWAIGIILLECLSLRSITEFDLDEYGDILPPYYGSVIGPRSSRLQRFLSGDLQKTELSGPFRNFLSCCLGSAAEYDVIDLLDHPLFSDLATPGQANVAYVLDPEPSFCAKTQDDLKQLPLRELYYWWLKFNEIEEAAEMENVFIGNGLVDYLPPILAVCDIYLDGDLGVGESSVVVKSIKVSIEPLLAFLSDVAREKPV